MYLYDSPVSFPRSQNLRLPGTLSRFGEPLAPSPDLIIDDFDFDRADLKPSHKNRIDQLAQQIVDSWKTASTRPALGLRVVGHTDKFGGEDYNKGLGRRRAEKVLGRLTGLIMGGDIDTYQRMSWSLTSEGKAKPRSSVHAKNRRVEIFIDWGQVKAPPPPPPPPRPLPSPQCVADCKAQEKRRLDRTRFYPECLIGLDRCIRACSGPGVLEASQNRNRNKWGRS